MLDLRRLRHLSALSRLGTIAEVARAAGYTPSAVSQALLQLEREVGVPLLERDGRRVRLTPAARSLVARADRALAELDAAEAELAAGHAVVQGRVLVGSFPSAAARIVLPAAGVLAERHPDVEVVVREHEPEDGLPLLRSGELDLLVSEAYEDVEPAPAGGLELHPLLTEPLLVVLPATRGGGDVVELEELSDADWIGGLAGTQYAVAVERACRAAGFAARIVHRADEAMLIQALVAAGSGVGLLPRLACTPSPEVRHVGGLPAPPARHIQAHVRGGASHRPALAAILTALRQVATDVAMGL